MINRIKKYIRDIQLEWQKVSKPDWKSVQGNTLVVIVACIILGVFLWLVDGTADFPKWFSPFGLILLVVVIPLCVYFMTRNNTPQWKIATLVSFSPLAIVLILSFFVDDKSSIKGFGLVLLRSLFLR